MDEIWALIDAFPDYKISNHGRVIRISTGRIMKESYTKAGVAKVGFVMAGIQHTRSVKVLVAEAFVSGCTDDFDTPIQLDGNQRNNRADNLIWRPRYFAWRYARQFKVFGPEANRGPLVDLDTGILYLDIFEAAIKNGLLVHDVWRSVYNKVQTFPTWQRFSFIE